MIERYEGLVVDVISRLMVPVIQLFALYVVFHGHYSPGGGFQGGVILATSVVLMRLTLGQEESHRRFPPRFALGLLSAGIFVLGSLSAWPLLSGGVLLDYSELPLPVGEEMRRYYGILFFELAVAAAVWGSLVTIFDSLTGNAP